jgi:hypothetical protein
VGPSDSAASNMPAGMSQNLSVLFIGSTFSSGTYGNRTLSIDVFLGLI